jgi:Ni/Fe-hydrogenase subunit HybB-like protein
MRLRVTKTILWLVAGLAPAILVMRVIHGPGSVTALTDIIPWGLWKGGGVVALVAIGGAGFTVAMLVYIFNCQVFKPVVRGAVLLALLCYSSVGFGLTVDIGIWWRIVFPVWHWQIHSVLFEVAWCIMLYLVVLSLEFSHTVLARVGWHRLLSLVEKATMVIVIAGISLSTLHQSSLGTLFLATPFRLHPLWHTDFLPLLFFISSIGIGCLTISMATLFVHWLYGKAAPMRAISALGAISAVAMSIYAVLRFSDIIISGKAAALFVPSWDVTNFWFETLLSAVIPVALLAQKRFRASPAAMFWIAMTATLGLALNRVNVSGLATLSLTHSHYVPSWTEWAVSAGIVAAAGLMYLFCVENLGLFSTITAEDVRSARTAGPTDLADWRTTFFGAHRHGEARLYSLVFVTAIAASFGFLSDDAVFGVKPMATATSGPRRVPVVKCDKGCAAPYVVAAREDLATASDGAVSMVLMVDGNRNGRYVLFDHDAHLDRVDGGATRCERCHHMNKPLDSATGCSECHRDQYLTVDLFDHRIHENHTGGNTGCTKCHRGAESPRTRANTPRCTSCHANMRPENTRVQVADASMRDRPSGYMQAMHCLCIDCHRERKPTLPVERQGIDQCAGCHGDLPPTSEAVWQSWL